MRNATVLVLRLKGVATETIKNIVLAGIGTLIVVDSEDVSAEDLATGFFFRDEDVGRKVSTISVNGPYAWLADCTSNFGTWIAFCVSSRHTVVIYAQLFNIINSHCGAEGCACVMDASPISPQRERNELSSHDCLTATPCCFPLTQLFSFTDIIPYRE